MCKLSIFDDSANRPSNVVFDYDIEYCGSFYDDFSDVFGEFYTEDEKLEHLLDEFGLADSKIEDGSS